MRLGYEGSDIDVYLEAGSRADPGEELDDGLRFADSPAGDRQADHEVELRLPEPGSASLFEDGQGPFEGYVLVYRALPFVHGRLHGEGQSRLSDLRELAHYRECEAVDLQGGKLERDSALSPFGIQSVEQTPDAGIIPRGERGEGYLAVAAAVDQVLDLRPDDIVSLDPLRAVEIPGMAETASVGAATHDFDRAVVLDRLQRWQRQRSHRRGERKASEYGSARPFSSDSVALRHPDRILSPQAIEHIGPPDSPALQARQLLCEVEEAGLGLS